MVGLYKPYKVKGYLLSYQVLVKGAAADGSATRRGGLELGDPGPLSLSPKKEAKGAYNVRA